MTFQLTPEQLATIAAIPDRWDTFSPEQQAAILAQLRAAVYDSSGFPVRYRNRDTGRVYKPHNIAEKLIVENHIPKRVAILGGEGCVAAETLINGVPIAELTSPSLVPTAVGLVPSTSAFWKGKADLYRLQTKSGGEVVATLEHRFLTRTGWRQLRDLAVGDVIAGCDSCHVHAESEINAGDGVSPQNYIPFSYPNNSLYWTTCQSVSYVGYGDYYDIHVPFWNHYIAGGLLHHNSGKTTQSSAKSIGALRLVTNGMMASPSLPHFRRSAWSEFVRWLPPEAIIEKHKERLSPSWEPREPFRLVCNNGAYLDCAGIVNVGSIEGPNIHFFWLDEARHIDDPNVPKTIEGRVRIPGPNGEPSQWWLSSTPPPTTDHWMYTYFGPMLCSCPKCGDIYLRPQYFYTESQLLVAKRTRPDIYPLWANTGAVILSDDGTARLGYEEHTLQSLGRFRSEWLMPERRLQDMPLLCPNCLQLVAIKDDFAAFKLDSAVIALLTQENVTAGNLERTFLEQRGESLGEGEKNILLWAEWGDTADQAPFLPTMLWWDNCATIIPLLRNTEPMIVALDAATGRTTSDSDCFAILGITRHWDDALAGTHLAVRFYKTWRARAGQKINFEGTEDDPGPERVLRWLCENYSVIMVTFDPTELHDMAQRLGREGLSWFNEFSQSSLRYEADRELLTLIQEGRIVHDGSQELRQHLMNADRKLDASGKKMRIVKRSQAKPIDLAVCLSMGAFFALKLILA